MEGGTFGRRHWVVILLGLTLFVGGFLRMYHFSDWLHFELDQARDARVVDDGLRGDFFDLPLLGPKAAGTSLRLPPSFYYLEYFGALLFGESPAGQASIILIFSILTLGAAYFFFRRCFSLEISLGLTMLMAVSAFLVFYGRFAWNPNLLPFFLVFGFYALLRSVDVLEERAGFFLGVATLMLGLATQFHFLAFVSIPIITALFLLIKRPKIAIRFWGVALSIVVFLYTPLFLNEVATGGRNTTEFIKALSSKTNKGEHIMIEKVVRNGVEQVLGYGLVLTGYEKADLPKLDMQPAFDIVCDGGCRAGLGWGAGFALFYFVGFLSLGWLLWKTLPGRARDTFLLVFLWFSVTWILFLNIAFDFAPRFFLLIVLLPFLWLGFLLTVLQKVCSKRVIWFVILFGLLLLLVGTNSVSLERRFTQLGRAGTTALVLDGPDRILKERTRVTLKQQNAIIDFLEQRSKASGFPIYMHSEPQHRRALKYLLEKRGIENDVLNVSTIYQEGLYFLILRSQSDLQDGMRKYLEKYTVAGTFPFGTLTVIEFAPKLEAVTAKRQDFNVIEINARDPHAAPRYTWREFWKRSSTKSDEPETDEESQLAP